jgi:hypothetical protein
MARNVVALLCVCLLPGCISVTKVRGPDGTDDWLALQCGGGLTRCWEEAANQCPHGYVIADSGTQTTVSSVSVGKTQSVTSGTMGELLIKCKTVDDDGQSSAVAKEERQEANLTPPVSHDACRLAFDHVDDLADAWAESHADRARGPLPTRFDFMAVCRDLPLKAQRCLVMPWAQAHADTCEPTISALDERTRQRLEALFFKPDE